MKFKLVSYHPPIALLSKRFLATAIIKGSGASLKRTTTFCSHRSEPRSSLIPFYLFGVYRMTYLTTANTKDSVRINDNSTMTKSPEELELLCINTIRAVSADQPQAANSGHPGAPMGCAPMAYVLWKDIMSYSSKDPSWINRDRFVLSNGHACALQYTMLHLTGYNVTTKDLSQFRRLGSKTPGHPESFVTEGTRKSKRKCARCYFI